MTYWVNIDKPTSSYKLHRSTYRYCNTEETQNKGIGEIKKDGGWLLFNLKKEARHLWESKHKNLKWDPCKICARA